FDERRLKMNVSMELDSSELLKRFVAAEVGIGFITHSNVEADVKAKELIALPLAEEVVRRDLGLIYRKDKALSRAALASVDVAVTLKQVPAVPQPLKR